MNIKLMNIERQHLEHKDDYEQAAMRVLRSGNYIGGKEVEDFELEFAKYEGAKFGISCGNGTDALIIALRALNIGGGDEVITVAWTFFATAESIASVGATPVFVDVDKKTYCIDHRLIENAITSRTKAVLIVHFYGNCCEMDSIKKICKKHNLYLIADCAQATGTEYCGERKNILGDISCFSFFPTKNLGCDGDGGMILTDDETLAKACRAFRVHGSGRDGLLTFNHQLSSKGMELPKNIAIGETKYYNYLIGYNSRLDAIQAAILKEKIRYIDSFIERRRNNANYYYNALKNSEYITPFVGENCFHSYYIFALKHKKADAIIKYLNDNGVGSGVYYPIPLHLQGAFSYLKYKPGDLPVTEELAKTTFAIPVFPELFEEEKEYIVQKLFEAMEVVK